MKTREKCIFSAQLLFFELVSGNQIQKRANIYTNIFKVRKTYDTIYDMFINEIISDQTRYRYCPKLKSDKK